MPILPSPPYFATPPLLYFAHPVSGGATGTPAKIEATIQANLARARRWVNFLLHEMPDVALELSWLSYIEALTEGQQHRERGLRDDEINARRCDGIILCGGMMTNGMERELRAVQEGVRQDALPFQRSAIVIDLLSWNAEPPWTIDRTTGAMRPSPLTVVGCFGPDPALTGPHTPAEWIRREIAKRTVSL